MSDDIIKPGPLLARINSPADLRQLDEEQLPQLCDELRQYIIDVVSRNPGHLGASLGTVELTVALHYVFDTPHEKLVWDVGHQAYGHKILTNRRDQFLNYRTLGGLSGFPKREESEYDSFGTGHSSTSISAILGMATASTLDGRDGRHYIAIIGDGSMTGGQAFEGLNNAGTSHANLLVIYNDNGISIDKNVGAIQHSFTRLTSSPAYNRLKNTVWKLLGGGTRHGAYPRRIIQQLNSALKGSILKKSNFFEYFSFRYFGPTDGHDVLHLVKLLRDLRQIQGPKVLHVITVKGKGIVQAEQDQTKYHAPGRFDRRTGEVISDPCNTHAALYQTVFGRTLLELAETNPRIVGITPAMPTGCSLNIMMHKMPDRAFDVGIAEQHAVTFSAGMAVEGKLPFCNIYSSFMQRAYDQVIHDVALQNLSIVFCLDRGGLVGEDGPTHHGVFDLAYLRCVPNMIVAAPSNEKDLRNLMYTAQAKDWGPFAIRYPRGRGIGADWKGKCELLEPGTSKIVREGADIAFIAIGHPVNFAIAAAEELSKDGIEVSVIDMVYLKPHDEALLYQVIMNHKYIITVEDGTILGGLGSLVIERANEMGSQSKIVRLGVPDAFVQHGSPEELHRQCGFDPQGIIAQARKLLQSSASGAE